MDNYINNFLFTYFPYIALAVFFFGVITRLVWMNKTIQAESSQFLADKKVKLASNLFHVGIIFVFFGHLTLFIPEWLYHMVMTTETKRVIALSMGSIFGIMAVIGLIILVIRRFTAPRIKYNSGFNDYLIIVLLLVEAVIGLTAAAKTAVEPIGTYAALSEWSQAIVTFQPNAGLILANHPLQYKLHIVLGLFIFMIFPYTKLMHMLVFPYVYFFRSGYQLVRSSSISRTR
ncbi:MAG: respiratory nitrate reductase subunit gamma [Fermentimonas sp.]|nr:respiratory nitrate reductase subunit gamma [Fermentimonas sp.]